MFADKAKASAERRPVHEHSTGQRESLDDVPDNDVHSTSATSISDDGENEATLQDWQNGMSNAQMMSSDVHSASATSISDDGENTATPQDWRSGMSSVQIKGRAFWLFLPI